MHKLVPLGLSVGLFWLAIAGIQTKELILRGGKLKYEDAPIWFILFTILYILLGLVFLVAALFL